MKNIFHKTHLILGLCSGLIFIIIGLTGSVLSFEQEVLAYLNKHTYKVPISKKEKIPFVNLLEDFKEQHNTIQIDKITFSNVARKPIILYTHNTQNNTKQIYYINPYTADILENEVGVSFFRTVESIHRTLLLKDFGKGVVGISMIIFIVLIISGTCLLLIKFKRKPSRMFAINLKGKGKFLLSNLHSTLGMWVFPFYLVSILSGLNWSYPLYNDTLYALLDIDKPKRSVTHKESVPQIPSTIEIDKAMKMFNDEVAHKYSYSLFKIPTHGSVYSFLYMDENANHRRERNKLSIDLVSKKIIKHERFENKPLKEQIMISMLTIHTGEYFGLFGKIIMFIIALLLPILCLSGIILYMKKRKIK